MVAIGNFEVESYSKLLQLCVSNEELKETAARICRDYLTGAWKTINTEEIKFRRISGGLSNFLFYVSLPDGYDCPLASSSSTEQLTNSVTKRVRKDSGPSFAEPKEILLRIYGQTHGEHALETMLTESVVFTLLSERNLGPKLHGIFPGGRIEQYIPARPLTTLELSDYRISMKIAEKMASIHSLNIPVSKEPDWLWKSMDRWLQSAEAILAEDANDHKSIIEEVKQTKLSKEVAWLKSIILNADYQVVFCHNDLQEGNILFKEMSSRESSRENSAITASDDFDDLATDGPNFNAIHSSRELNGGMLTSLNGKCRKRSLASTDSLNDLDSTQDSVISNNSEDCDPDLFIIDYEYCAYNYRGFDLANHFVEWTIDYKNEQYPYYYYKASQYPTTQQRHDFISSYLKKVAQIDYESYTPTQEDIEELDNEVTVFTMVSHLFWTLWSIVNVHQNIEFGYWDYALTRLREYNVAKNKFKSNNGTIVKDD